MSTCTIPNCICKAPGANPRAHGQPPKKCDVCGGETGMHRMMPGGFCPRTFTEGARVIGYDISREDFRKMVAPEHQHLLDDLDEEDDEPVLS